MATSRGSAPEPTRIGLSLPPREPHFPVADRPFTSVALNVTTAPPAHYPLRVSPSEPRHDAATVTVDFKLDATFRTQRDLTRGTRCQCLGRNPYLL